MSKLVKPVESEVVAEVAARHTFSVSIGGRTTDDFVVESSWNGMTKLVNPAGFVVIVYGEPQAAPPPMKAAILVATEAMFPPKTSASGL